MKLFLLCAVIAQGALGAPQDQWGNWKHHGQVPVNSMAPDLQLQMILEAQRAQQEQQNPQNQQQQAQQAQMNLGLIQALIQERQNQEMIQREIWRQQLIERQQQWEQELGAFQNGLSQWQNVPQQLFQQQGLQPGPSGSFQQRLEEKYQTLGQLWNNRPGLLGRPGKDREEGRRPHHHLRPHKPGRQPRPQQPPQQQPEQQILEEPNNPEQTQSIDKAQDVLNEVQTAVDLTVDTGSELTDTVETDSTPDTAPEYVIEQKSEDQTETTSSSSSTDTVASETEEIVVEES